jgi:hypothetical protein
MAQHHDIDFIFREWPYQPGVISARLVQARDGREVLQMRMDMGLLQMEVTDRPDGQRPGGMATYLDLLRSRAGEGHEAAPLTEEECFEIDREFIQYYHRRICCLALRKFDWAVADADHTLALMDFVATHAPDAQWALSHERYRGFVHFHRTQAAALAALERSGAEAAVEELNAGLDRLRQGFAEYRGAEPHGEAGPPIGEDNELIAQLDELKEALRKEYHLGKTLGEQLAEAVAAEEYERAARLRDEIARRRPPI